jgi:hypothetical protein
MLSVVGSPRRLALPVLIAQFLYSAAGRFPKTHEPLSEKSLGDFSTFKFHNVCMQRRTLDALISFHYIDIAAFEKLKKYPIPINQHTRQLN